MTLDTMIYAAVAVGLIAWLRTLLGTRHGAERERTHYLVAAEQDVAEPPKGEAREADAGAGEQAEWSESVAQGAREGLTAIAAAERGFGVQRFLAAAGDSFAYVTEDFATGDADALAELVTPEVAQVFADAIAARAEAKQSAQAEVRAVTDAQIVAARLEGRTARVAVRFTAEQVRATLDADGAVVAGDPARVVTTTDTWTFVRRLGDRDPRWWVAETGGA
jgi:predicted lipid-binding transport protein (Tim44 family)